MNNEQKDKEAVEWLRKRGFFHRVPAHLGRCIDGISVSNDSDNEIEISILDL